ncbi:MAG: hypothetical protein HS126_14400 [Anaerolineales bacterium]|nr:hypothetical protein [Anaerolineales bacterium]
MKRERPRGGIEIEQFNHPVLATGAGAMAGFIASFPAQIGAAALGLDFGLDDPWTTLVIGGVGGGALAGGLLGYRMRRLKRQASWLAILWVLVAGFGGALLMAGINRAGAITFTCQRPEPKQIDCTLIERRWWGASTQRTESFKGVKTARVEPLSGGVGELVVIVAAGGESGLYGFPLDTTERLKHFTDSAESNLVIEQNDWRAALTALAVGGFLFLAGCAGSWRSWPGRRVQPETLPAAKGKKPPPVKPFELVEQTPTKLTLRINPEKPGVWFGLILMLPGLWLVDLICREGGPSRGANWLFLGGMAMVVGIFFLLGLGITISYSQAQTATFDKIQHRATITRPGWLGRKVIELPFSEIAEIREMGGQVMLMLASGKMIGLRSGGSGTKMAELIRSFIPAQNSE